jgi:chromosome partitioning protein
VQRVLIASSKGGCGKSTLTTNLAVALAHAGRRVALFDCDHQGSSLEWARVRGAVQPAIPVQASAEGEGFGAGWSLKIAPGTDVVLIDTPAGLRRFHVAELLRRCERVLVPIVPSAMDLRATLPFLSELGAQPLVGSGRVRVGLVANPRRERTIASRELDTLTRQLPFPLVASIRDSQAYVLTTALGKGIFDYRTAATAECRAEWAPLLTWLDERLAAGPQAELALGPPNNVVPMPRA